jgi:hypothetical protein
MPDLTLAERLPAAFPSYDDDTEFSTWLAAHQDEVDALGADLAGVQKSLQVAHATGDELDRIGADFGILGRRRSRDDEAYRQYLMTLVQAFRGRGRVDDVRFAVASGLTVAEAAVTLDEDVQETSYDVVLTDWTSHKGSTVEELADIADPSAVDLDLVRYDIGVDEATTADGVTVDTGLKVADAATTADAVADVQTGDVPAGDSWDDESWDFMLWSEPEDLTRDAGTDTAVATDGVAVDPNETSVADAATTADGVSYSTDRTGWDVGDWGEIDWGATP